MKLASFYKSFENFAGFLAPMDLPPLGSFKADKKKLRNDFNKFGKDLIPAIQVIRNEQKKRT